MRQPRASPCRRPPAHRTCSTRESELEYRTRGIEVKQAPGRKIGNVTTRGNLVLLELDEGVISNHNLFDLDKRTIRFTPDGAGFRAENLPLEWNAATGSPLSGDTVRLTKFAFPFSG